MGSPGRFADLQSTVAQAEVSARRTGLTGGVEIRSWPHRDETDILDERELEFLELYRQTDERGVGLFWRWRGRRTVGDRLPWDTHGTLLRNNSQKNSIARWR